MSMPCRMVRRPSGFTLIEVMVTVAIVGILAAIAYPSYTSYITRSRIIDATSKLSDYRVRMEQWYQDNRTYLNGAACGATVPAAASTDAFTVSCTGTATGYTVKADGISTKGMGAFKYSLTLGATGLTKSTDAVPTGWSKSATCWTTRQDGSCG
ncbi:MAG TPA: type IV pilin protein [Casimicrobiaceae bacterium]